MSDGYLYAGASPIKAIEANSDVAFGALKISRAMGESPDDHSLALTACDNVRQSRG